MRMDRLQIRKMVMKTMTLCDFQIAKHKMMTDCIKVLRNKVKRKDVAFVNKIIGYANT